MPVCSPSREVTAVGQPPSQLPLRFFSINTENLEAVTLPRVPFSTSSDPQDSGFIWEPVHQY